MKALIYSVEDDEDIALIINKTLKMQDYEVETFPNGKSFIDGFKKMRPNLVLLDLMLPDISGYDLLKFIRSDSSNDEVQVLIISAKSGVLDRVEGLDLGADDYIVKPFDILELMSRVNSKVRRLSHEKVLEVKDIQLDQRKKMVTCCGEKLDLTLKEYQILELLMENQGQTVTRDELFSKIWNSNYGVESRTVDMHINSLRNKLKKSSCTIKTIYAIGYRMEI